MFNAALNYLYGCTYSVIHQGILAAKLDPYVGLLHVNGLNKSSLTYDLIEPIRPLIDRLLLQLIDEQKLDASHFKNNAKAVWIHKKGKKVILTAFHNYLYQKIEINKQILPVKTHCYLLAQNLKKEIDIYVSNHV
ncbi:CRISPR-associated endonuclease Cas1 [Kordia periserrulae]|uniref:CRISPR-associated endonuclease Cas1 n=2 Tax=Kordia periserrulae TaxID=701523 RepID=A0A2T6BV26_9FLAO|nr:CRISPR-associated endonuclease Cas1 [Kordia periserrulae]